MISRFVCSALLVLDHSLLLWCIRVCYQATRAEGASSRPTYEFSRLVAELSRTRSARSGATQVRKLGYLPIREIVIIT